jgi:mRNA interferase RelE/StbE
VTPGAHTERALLAELTALYRDVDGIFEGARCEASTECCRFGITGREPQVTSVEIALLRAVNLGPTNRVKMADLRALLRLDPQIVRWAIKKMLLLERDPQAGAELHGTLIGWRKLTVSNRDWRIIWRVTSDESGTVIVDVAEVWAVGARADSEVYEEMRSRVAALPPEPKTVGLTEVIERLGKAAGQAGLSAAQEPSAGEPVPDWLAKRLTHQVGLAADTVASMSLEEAVDAWTSWTSRQR